ncbi:EamA family transporter RarD [Heyndrickxia oleronia]|uniref:EamA family transporter n=1 Tax=Heyndrickxia oleronia TaxID=38875 RepID=A0A8E2IBD8_9BACI|nr:EamA family transporter RarD [Heyndrickxia oleronia]NYV64327.1 EamA family transporter RarD [Bacillus sp. Gen3]OJH17406.1 EamA family transporter [Bacillus obstructivus]MBU5212564.1 EamA family transporter RarD [Heyndrickxia oleronia]MCM3455968.1 EamA family transporter RarD [Heyndrickxia oleronia]MEC1374043.1 EamA family transporter RarD [Heyndrickxia oleronia]
MKHGEKIGVFYAAFSYIIWGVLPVYWKWLSSVSAEEILANRIFWSFIFMLVLLAVTKKWKVFLQTLKGLKVNKKVFLSLILASLLITANWFIYIWAVNENHIVETSLGYYINPLISILLGVFILKEKLNKAQIISFCIAALGVLILTISYGDFPWISFSLAITFGLYGLVKKMIKVDSAIGLTLETMTVAPLALIYMIYLLFTSNFSFLNGSLKIDLLLIGAGAATAIPLLLFAKGAQRIPLYLLGFLQYIAPTIMLILGVLVYHEHFSTAHMIAFICIWTAAIVLSIGNSKWFISLTNRIKKDKSFSA